MMPILKVALRIPRPESASPSKLQSWAHRNTSARAAGPLDTGRQIVRASGGRTFARGARPLQAIARPFDRDEIMVRYSFSRSPPWPEFSIALEMSMRTTPLQFSPVQRNLDRLYPELLELTGGQVASHIPEFTRADPSWPGIAIGRSTATSTSSETPARASPFSPSPRPSPTDSHWRTVASRPC
jgi:hypothetical protein